MATNGLILPDFAGRFNAGRDRATRNMLLQRQLEQENADLGREEQTRNLLAEYTMPGASPEERAANLNRLMAVNPGAAMEAQSFQNKQTTFQQQQAEAERALQREQAQQVVRRMQRVLASPNPEISLRVNSKFEGGDLVERLAEMGVIDPSDGIDADEARRIAQLTIDEMAPLAGFESPQTNVGTYNPRDYTTESWAQFLRTGDPSALKRFETIRMVDLGGGRSGILSSTGDFLGEVSKEGFETGVRDTQQAETEGKLAAETAADIAAKTRANQTALNLWNTAREGLISGLQGTNTGPMAGRIPAVTTGQQVAEGAIAAVAPVLKQLFRQAGEGVFTDKDQELLLSMIPKRTDSEEARVSMMRNIDAIIQAKLTAPPPPPKDSAPGGTVNVGGASVSWSVE